MQLNLPIVVAYEDRASAIPGVELLARSLQHHSPNLKLLIYSPLEAIADRLTDLLSVSFIKTTDFADYGWNAKPAVLLRALTEHEQVLWLDTDVIINGDIGSLLAKFENGTLVVGQEFRGNARDGGSIRATAYGFTPTRTLPHAVNSGSVLVSRMHGDLLRAWSALLSDLRYQTAQARPIRDRPTAFVGDQDALWALLTAPEFSHQKVEYFRVGSDMIQHSGANGYHVIDRLSRPLGRGPVFIHMLGRYKPWSFEQIPSARRQVTDYLHMVCFELSPYFEVAQPYADKLGFPEWLRRRTLPARFLNLIFGGNVALRGLPLALVSWAAALSGRRPAL